MVADSSKTPAQALLLATIPGIDLRLVHLVRDSRGVAYSWRRGFRERAGSDRQSLRLARMGEDEVGPAEAGELLEARPERSPRRRGVAGASLRWLLYNLVTPRLRSNGVPGITLRYENLVSEPRTSLVRILEFAGVPSQDADLVYLDGHRLVLEPNHTVHGSNRLRFKTGELMLQLDEEWRREMRGKDRALATAMTFPLLLRYVWKDGQGVAQLLPLFREAVGQESTVGGVADRVRDGVNSNTASSSVTVTVNTTFNDWRTNKFSATELTNAAKLMPRRGGPQPR